MWIRQLGDVACEIERSERPKPALLAAHTFPLDAAEDHRYKRPVMIADRSPPAEWKSEQQQFQTALCRQLGVTFEKEARAMLVGSPSADVVVTKYGAYAHAIWYARRGADVYPILVTNWLVAPGVVVADLPFVNTSPSRREALAALADAIETSGEHLPEGTLMQLWDAAKRMHSSA
jgi:hypothetical protein